MIKRKKLRKQTKKNILSSWKIKKKGIQIPKKVLVNLDIKPKKFKKKDLKKLLG